MKITCNIVKDLLPLYHDKICSEDTALFVEEHLKECENCNRELDKISMELSCPQTEVDDTKPLKAMAAAWKKGRMKSFLKGTLIALLSCALLILCFIGLTQWKVIPVSEDLLEISDISRLQDGRIVYHLYVKDNRDLHFIKFTTKQDGSYYLTPMRSVIEGERKMENGLFNDYFTVDIAENNAWQQSFGDGIEINSCYVGPEDSGILIWKEGMDLPEASDEIEKLFVTNNE